MVQGGKLARRLATLSALSLLCLCNQHGAQVAAQPRMTTSNPNQREASKDATNSATDVDAIGPLSAGKLRSLGEEAAMERRFDEAIAYIRQAIQLEPDSPLNHYRMFHVHKRMRKLGDALADLTKALEIDGGNANYRKER